LTIVLSNLQFTDSDYYFGVFRTVNISTCKWSKLTITNNKWRRRCRQEESFFMVAIMTWSTITEMFRFPWIVHFWLLLRYSLMFIFDLL